MISPTVLYTFVMALSGNSMPNICQQQLRLSCQVSTCSHGKYRYIFFIKSAHHAGFSILDLTRNYEKKNIVDISQGGNKEEGLKSSKISRPSLKMEDGRWKMRRRKEKREKRYLEREWQSILGILIEGQPSYRAR